MCSGNSSQHIRIAICLVMAWIQFIATCSAAFIAAISVFFAAGYQARLTRRRDDEIRKESLISETTELFLWLENCAVRLERAEYRLIEFADRCSQGVTSVVSLNYANFRHYLAPVLPDEAREQFRRLSRFPIQLGISVSYALGLLADEYSPRNANVFRDDLPLGESDFRHWADMCRQARDLIKVAQAQIANTMNKQYGTSFPMPGDLADIARRVRAVIAENQT